MPIPKHAAFISATLTESEKNEVIKICKMLDMNILTDPKDVCACEQNWNPSQSALDEVKRLYEAPGMDWEFSIQPNPNDLAIIRLK